MKKIIAFALSIAVLFAFAACEAGTIPPYYGKTVESITLLSAPDYIVGETLNPADLSFRVVYDNGEEVTRTGADLGLAPTKTGTDSKLEIDSNGSYKFADATAKEFGIVYGTSRPTSGSAVTEKDIWKCTITPVAASTVDFVVDPTNAAKEITKGSSLTDAELEGIVVTAKLPKGDKIVSAKIAEIDAADKANLQTLWLGLVGGQTVYKANDYKVISGNFDNNANYSDSTDTVTIRTKFLECGVYEYNSKKYLAAIYWDNQTGTGMTAHYRLVIIDENGAEQAWYGGGSDEAVKPDENTPWTKYGFVFGYIQNY